MSAQDAIAFRKACADLADTLIDGGPWRSLFVWLGWQPGRFPSQETDPE